MSEKAIGYFERASLMQPDEVKWRLMIASCYRRSGNYHKEGITELFKITDLCLIRSRYIVESFRDTR